MKNALGQDVVYLECECTDPSHTVRVLYEPGRPQSSEGPWLYLDVQFPVVPFYRRVWIALRYLFGKQYVWHDYCFTDSSVHKLSVVLQKYKLVKTIRTTLHAKRSSKENASG